jgi:hypothetical protein
MLSEKLFFKRPRRKQQPKKLLYELISKRNLKTRCEWSKSKMHNVSAKKISANRKSN